MSIKSKLNNKSFSNKRSSKNKNLPQKICDVCKRPFDWRRKWKKDWENVKYCSKKCSSLAR